MPNPNALKKILVFDIETVSVFPRFNDLTDRMQALWTKKANQISRNKSEPLMVSEVEEVYRERSGIYSEFAKVVCISVGVFVVEDGILENIRTKSYYGHDEKTVIETFFNLIRVHFDNPLVHILAGHNIREFDMPFLCRRAMIHGLGLPRLFQIQGKRPWQVEYVYDTLEMWRFGDYKNYTSLDLVAALFDIPTPKDDMDGSMVGHVYWEENDLARIFSYCEKDIVTSCKVLMHLMQVEYDKDVKIISSTNKEEEE